jgi:hypothetical protein
MPTMAQWKNGTFAIGFGRLLWRAVFLEYPDWDIGLSLLVAASTYLTADCSNKASNELLPSGVAADLKDSLKPHCCPRAQGFGNAPEHSGSSAGRAGRAPGLAGVSGRGTRPRAHSGGSRWRRRKARAGPTPRASSRST